MKVFQELGDLIEKQWRMTNYDEVVFPSLAAQLLTASNISQTLDAWEIVGWVHSDSDLPAQDIDLEFGNPPVTLYRGSRFYIEAYFWLDGTTAVHQHAFAGAFQVLSGSSLHSVYDFQLKQRINSQLLIGETSLRSVEMLERGDVRPIQPGQEFIHSLFHLDRPSVSLAVRTYALPEMLPQYTYLKPYLAIDPHVKDAIGIRRAQTAALLLSTGHPDAVKIISDGLTDSDFHTTFTVLEEVYEHYSQRDLGTLLGLQSSKGDWEELLVVARRKHGELIDLLLAVFAERERQRNIIKRRGAIIDAEHRFFLALLLNINDRASFLKMINHHFPDRSPVEVCLEWTETLSQTKIYGSPELNVLGIAGFDENYLAVYEQLLDGRTLNETITAITQDTKLGLVEAEVRKEVRKIEEALRNSILATSIAD